MDFMHHRPITCLWFTQITILLLFGNLSQSALAQAENRGPIGVLVSPAELAVIKDKSREGIAPYQQNLEEFLHFIDSLMESSSGWQELSGEVIVHDRSSSDPIQLSSTGGKLAYGTALAWHLTGEEKYAEKSRSLILDLTDTYGYRNDGEDSFHWGAQGILNLARGGTPYMYAADLLESWSGWSQKDKLQYQIWLRDIMYPKVAWASRRRKNNWGVAGSFSSALIAWYLRDHPDWELKEISPREQILSPEAAFESHNQYQIGRMLTSDEWKMDGKVELWGILPNGAIPEEIRRGDDPIDGDYLPTAGSGTHYTMTFIEHLTAHAEFLRRLGDTSLYDHISRDGSGSLLQAYLFVVENPIKSHCFTPNRINALYFAYDYYQHPALLAALQECGPGNISGQRLALFGRLTRPVAERGNKYPTQ
ncbi:Alginate lyase [Cyclobacterium lianum]|uniref:Alginate lyase n=1 Tax=Cyclobacterium lianum TaxID=388280 RepID=A0A1M7QTK3_9BACT|nr:alginate lyase family protein [Cyclobacterium lianum]SHN35152.1 Alginate lyase [Cyclobacterium lianum]